MILHCHHCCAAMTGPDAFAQYGGALTCPSCGLVSEWGPSVEGVFAAPSSLPLIPVHVFGTCASCGQRLTPFNKPAFLNKLGDGTEICTACFKVLCNEKDLKLADVAREEAWVMMHDPAQRRRLIQEKRQLREDAARQKEEAKALAIAARRAAAEASARIRKFKLTYVRGVPGLNRSKKIKLVIDDDSMTFDAGRDGAVRIPLAAVTEVDTKKESEMRPAKFANSSAIGRAMLGGLLAGGIGLVAGAASSGMRVTQNARTADTWFLMIGFVLDGVENVAVLHGDTRDFWKSLAASEVNAAANVIVTKRQAVRGGGAHRSIADDREEAPSGASAVERMAALDKLKEMGAVSDEEYEAKRKQIIESV